MKSKKELTIKDFQETNLISYDQIERTLGKRRFKQFEKFMFGQTVPAHTCPECKKLIIIGVYPWDLANFLRSEDKRFFD